MNCGYCWLICPSNLFTSISRFFLHLWQIIGSSLESKILYELDHKIGTIEKNIHYYDTSDNKEPAKEKPEAILDKFHKEDFPNCNEKEKTLIVEAVLDQAIRPALANDGGGVDILSIEGNVIKVHYQGACGTCPSSTTGTLSYIETFLKDTLHQDLTVQAQ